MKKKVKRKTAEEEKEGKQGTEKGEDNEEVGLKREIKGSGSGIKSDEPFASLPLSEPTMNAIKDLGFEFMTQVKILSWKPLQFLFSNFAGLCFWRLHVKH